MIEAMHSRWFDTALGTIGFDAKGDVTGFEPWGWYVWQADGTYVPGRSPEIGRARKQGIEVAGKIGMGK